MTYSEFKTRMTEDVKKYMDGNHPGYEVSLKKVAKVNRDFVEMIAISNKDTHEGPAIDVKELWDDAKRRGMSYEEMSREVKKRLDLTLKEVPEVVIDDLNDFKSRAILTLINTEKIKICYHTCLTEHTMSSLSCTESLHTKMKRQRQVEL